MDSTALKLKPRSLIIGVFNANGLRGMKDEVVDFLREHSVDIFLVQETFYCHPIYPKTLIFFLLLSNPIWNEV